MSFIVDAIFDLIAGTALGAWAKRQPKLVWAFVITILAGLLIAFALPFV